MRQSVTLAMLAALLAAAGATQAFAQAAASGASQTFPSAAEIAGQQPGPQPGQAQPAGPAGAAPAPGPDTAIQGSAVAAATPLPSCLNEIAAAEKRYRIPDGLLVSIGLAESGRRDPESGVTAPWPWTINALGAGHFYDSAAAAVQSAGAMLEKDGGFLDVGCMQVDLYHHPHAFATLTAAFDPAANVDYAARFLADLKRQHGSWMAAAAAYHSGDPAEGADYVAHVLYFWKEMGATPATAQALPSFPKRRGFLIDVRPSPIDVAARFYDKADFAAAQAIYRAVLDARPDDQAALLGMAQTLRSEGRSEDARLYLERVLTVNPDNRGAFATLLAMIDEAPPERKLPALLSARELVPTSSEIPARIAAIEAQHNNLREAVAEMALAVRLAPGDAVMRLNYALLLDRAGDRAAAAAAYRQFMQYYQPGKVALTVPLELVRQRLLYLEGHTP